MNGPVKMFRTRQIIRHDLPVELPHCMYKMKNIHGSSPGAGPLADHVTASTKSVDISEQNSWSIPDMTALENRQEEILKQLADLKNQMLTLRADLSSKNTISSKNKVFAAGPAVVCPIEASKLPNFVVNASPTHPPYSLLAIQKLWGDCLHLSVTTHLHSTLSSLSDDAAMLSQALEHYTSERNVPKVHLRLIWKDVGANTELVVAHLPIMGEANILRYLARIGINQLNYEDQPNQFEIDSLLDVCYCLSRSQSKTERSGLLRSLSKKLGKSQWLCGRSEFTIADIAANSAIKQVASKEVSTTLGNWMQRCDELFA